MHKNNFYKDNIIKFPTSHPYNKNSLQSIIIHFNNNNRDKLSLLSSINNILDITGQKPGILKSQKSVSAFKIRKGMEIGGILTLRNQNLLNFQKLLFLNLPLFNNSVFKLNKFNNLSFGLYPNSKLFSTTVPICGLNIILQFKGYNPDSNTFLLSSLGFPVL